MFKPSLKRTVLKQEMCTYEPQNNNKNQPRSYQASHGFNKSKFIPSRKFKTDIPSMLISEELLEDKNFSNNKCYTHTVSPLSYNFHSYPPDLRKLIKDHFQQFQIGVSQQIFYAVYKNNLYLWKEGRNVQDCIPRAHEFKENIQIIKAFVIKNPLIFKAEQLLILVMSFQNRVVLYSIDQNQLLMTDLMIKYKLNKAQKISKIQYTSNGQLIICGNNGQVCMVSFSSNKESVLQVKDNTFNKYLSEKSFDYYSEYVTKQAVVYDNFLYCLTQKHTKTNLILYGIKKLFSSLTGEKVQKINQKTYIDIYKLDENRTTLKYIDRLDQKQIQYKIKNSYSNYCGQLIQNGFKIASLIQSNNQLIQKQQGNKQKQVQMQDEDYKNQQHEIEGQQKVYQLLFKQSLSFITRCGYAITLKHRDSGQKEAKSKEIQKNMKNKIKTNFYFFKQPLKILQKLQKIALLDTIKINKSLDQKQFRKNYVITSKGFNNLTLMNDMLLFFGDKNISIIKTVEIQPAIFERSKKVTQRSNRNNNNQQQKYSEMQNLQRQWIVFNSQGHQNIYNLEPRHILLSYLYFKCQTNYMPSGEKNQKSQYVDRILDFDDNFHKIIQKLIKIYGYYQFNKMIVQLLLNFNQISNNQYSTKTEYVIMQKQLLQNIVGLQVTQQKYRTYEDWFYELANDKAIQIVQTQRISFYLWTLLMEYQYQPILSTEVQTGQRVLNYYNSLYEELSIDPVDNRRYSSYGYAIKSIFYSIVKPILNLRAKQYKEKYVQIKTVEQSLKILMQFLQQKNKKQNDRRYKNYSVQKMDRYNTEKLKTNTYNMQSNKLGNDSISTNHTNHSISGGQFQTVQFSLSTEIFIEKSIAEVQDKIYKSIQKMLTLIQVFSRLIQKDERAAQNQGIPTFGEVITNFKNQMILGQIFFKEECSIVFQQKNVQNHGLISKIFNSQLIKDVQVHLPQFGISDKISYFNFKKAKNILWNIHENTNTGNNIVDLKSLDMQALSSITSSSHIQEMRLLFIGTKDIKDVNNKFLDGKCQKYLQFVIIGIQKIIQKHDYLKSIQKTDDSKTRSNRICHLKLIQEDLKRESHIVTTQQLYYLQCEIRLFYDQVQTIFITVLQKFNETTGKQYYRVQSTLQFIIQAVVKNCYMDQSIMQFLERGLKHYKLIEKVMRMKRLQQKMKSSSSIQKQKIIIKREASQVDEVKKYIRQNQLSTLQIYQKMRNQSLKNTLQTNDTSIQNGLFASTSIQNPIKDNMIYSQKMEQQPDWAQLQ